MFCVYCGKPFHPQMQWTRHVMACAARSPSDPGPEELFGFSTPPAPTSSSSNSLPPASPLVASVSEVGLTPIEDPPEVDPVSLSLWPQATLPNPSLTPPPFPVARLKVDSGGWVLPPTSPGEPLETERSWSGAWQDAPQSNEPRELHDQELDNLKATTAALREASIRANLLGVVDGIRRLTQDIHAQGAGDKKAAGAVAALVNLVKMLVRAGQEHQELLVVVTKNPRLRVEARLRELAAQKFPDRALQVAYTKKLAEVEDAEKRMQAAITLSTQALVLVHQADDRLKTLRAQADRGPDLLARLIRLAGQLVGAIQPPQPH